MFYKKLSLLILFSLSASHASYATMGHSSYFDGIVEDAKTMVKKSDMVKESDWKKHLPNLKYMNTSSKGKEKEGSGNVTTTRPSLHDVLHTFRENLAISQEEHQKAADYAKAMKRPIAMNVEFMGSGFIFSASGNTAITLLDSNIYLPIYNPGDKRTTAKPLEIDAGANFAEAKELAFKAVEQSQRRSMLKSLGERFYNKSFFTNN